MEPNCKSAQMIKSGLELPYCLMILLIVEEYSNGFYPFFILELRKFSNNQADSFRMIWREK